MDKGGGVLVPLLGVGALLAVVVIGLRSGPATPPPPPPAGTLTGTVTIT